MNNNELDFKIETLLSNVEREVNLNKNIFSKLPIYYQNEPLRKIFKIKSKTSSKIKNHTYKELQALKKKIEEIKKKELKKIEITFPGRERELLDFTLKNMEKKLKEKENVLKKYFPSFYNKSLYNIDDDINYSIKKLSRKNEVIDTFLLYYNFIDESILKKIFKLQHDLNTTGSKKKILPNYFLKDEYSLILEFLKLISKNQAANINYLNTIYFQFYGRL